MKDNKLYNYLRELIDQVPADWIKLTTHRLDIYKEELAKTEFTERLEQLYAAGKSDQESLEELPTAYDYIRLGHPLSTTLEWALAKLNGLKPEQVISFSSQTMPVLAVLRKNLLENKKTRILYRNELPAAFDPESLKSVYGYQFELEAWEPGQELSAFEGSTLLISAQEELAELEPISGCDFHITTHAGLGSVIYVYGEENHGYIAAIQHVRRRESIAMTPANSFAALKSLAGLESGEDIGDQQKHKEQVIKSVREITGSKTQALLGSSGLSVQYAIMMGLVDDALEKHPDKEIKIIVPPNCYGGTNDQARRVAAAHPKVGILDLPVDAGNDMVQSIDQVLTSVAEMNAVPYIIAEIPTNPRVEVPDLSKLREALSTKRQTPQGTAAVDPVFILDQTFCPNVQFVSEQGILADIRTLSYVSGSKFPSGGKATAGYVVANEEAAGLMPKIEKHLQLCDNEATPLQVKTLAERLPSMNQRIEDAYHNTREFVNFIQKTLPEAKINFVSEELAQQGFTPSVFSLDLPTKGDTPQEREAHKRELNSKLIHMMITTIPEESKYCVSYGQLKGCYWTIPATSTQGTTKEEDKDYIARVSVSPELDLEKHKEVFADFVGRYIRN